MSDPRHDPLVAAGAGVRTLLAQEAIWAQPPPEMLERILARVDAAPPRRRALDRRRWPLLGGLAAAAAILAVLALGMGRGGDPNPHAPLPAARVALTGTPLAPQAHGTATVRDTPSGVDIRFDIQGLAPAPAGFYYEAWVKGPDGLVAIGTFHVRRPDDRPVRLWSGVDLARYPLLTVTLEPEDGNQASSGRRVLQGQG
jgi:hypothetical protein